MRDSPSLRTQMTTSPETRNSPRSPDAGSRSLRLMAAVAPVLCAGSAFLAPHSFWAAYLTAVVFWTGASLGCLGTTLLHRLTGGNWGWDIQRELNAATGALPVAILSLAPMLYGAQYVFPWAANDSAESVLNAHQQTWFAPTVLLSRLLLVIAMWCLLGRWCVVGNLRHATGAALLPSPRYAAIGLIALWLTMTIAAIDGLMSLSPGWSSSMFGTLHAMGFSVTGLALAIVARTVSIGSRALSKEEADTTQDLGSLLLAFNLLWAYFAFSEYLIIWSGDLPFEISWFVNRRHGWSLATAIGLVLLHFVVPFGCLLSRELKRDPRRLAAVAGLLLLMQLSHIAWTVFPAVPGMSPISVLFAVFSVVAIGGPWLLVFAAVHRRFPAVVTRSAMTTTAGRVAGITGVNS